MALYVGVSDQYIIQSLYSDVTVIQQIFIMPHMILFLLHEVIVAHFGKCAYFLFSSREFEEDIDTSLRSVL